MQPRSPKLLEDIRDAAAFIREVANGKSLAEYSAGLPGATGADKRKALRDLDHWRERLRSEGAGTEANACEIRRLLSEETAGSRPGQ